MYYYATFWQRFVAIWVDAFVLLPLWLLQIWLESISKASAVLLVFPMNAAYCGYTIYCHGRYGQTVGKYVMGIRVVRTTGEPIGWREAWLRSSVDVSFAVLGSISSYVALAAITDVEYFGIGWMQRSKNLAAYQPYWLAWTSTVEWIWFWSEVIIIFFNKRRQALHDLIAGTVVISAPKVPDS